MNADELRQEISYEYNDVSFYYNGKPSGISPEVHNSIPTFYVWYGDEEKEYSDVNKLMSDKFFDGKSLEEIADKVEYF